MTRDDIRAAMRLAQIAQRDRAESFSRGYRTEEKSFYGDSSVAQYGNAENRLTIRGADEEFAKMKRYELEQQLLWEQSNG